LVFGVQDCAPIGKTEAKCPSAKEVAQGRTDHHWNSIKSLSRLIFFFMILTAD